MFLKHEIGVREQWGATDNKGVLISPWSLPSRRSCDYPLNPHRSTGGSDPPSQTSLGWFLTKKHRGECWEGSALPDVSQGAGLSQGHCGVIPGFVGFSGFPTPRTRPLLHTELAACPLFFGLCCHQLEQLILATNCSQGRVFALPACARRALPPHQGLSPVGTPSPGGQMGLGAQLGGKTC